MHYIRRSAGPLSVVLLSVTLAQPGTADLVVQDFLASPLLSVSLARDPTQAAAKERRRARLEFALAEADLIRRGDQPIEGKLREQVDYLTQVGLAEVDAERIVSDTNYELIVCRIRNPVDDRQCTANARQQAGLAGFVPQERNRCDDVVRHPNSGQALRVACNLDKQDTEE